VATSASPPSSTASKAFLIVAVALGVLATVLAFAYISSAGSGNNGPTKFIVVAAHDMSPNAPLDPDKDLKQLAIPERFASLAQRCLDWEARASYKGERVNREIKMDQPVMLADISAVGELVLEKPYFALTLPAETGMIIPGDFVKIIVTKANLVNAAAGSAALASAMPYDAQIIGKDEGYKVLAVGGYLFKTRQQVLTSDQYGSSSTTNKTVTLQVTEAQAREIMGALGSVTSSTKAILLMGPSANTMAPGTETATTMPAANTPKKP
jgi:Flp pilus assembly protein CpaB